MVLGCIADDFTGATDLAGVLVERGVPTVLVVGVPDAATMSSVRDQQPGAVVVALKTRTASVGEAVDESLASLRQLRESGSSRFYYKYCSTFDSTPAGNIGPVIDALLDELGAHLTVVCPSFPANGRTLYQGHLFVGDRLLSESSMRHHPLTPMGDPDIVRVLARQTRSRVGLVDHGAVTEGAGKVRDALDGLRADGVRMAVVDAVDESDLLAIGAACADLSLVTGGSGLALGLAGDLRDEVRDTGLDGPPAPSGLRAVVAGSCSEATNAQVQALRAVRPAFAVDPFAVADGEDVAAAALSWARPRLSDGPVLVHATEPGEAVARNRDELPTDVGDRIERVLAQVAAGLVRAGVDQMIVAGGETSGAVVTALGVRALRIGPQIAPGVPWTTTLNSPTPVWLALKSGNFGGPSFFLDAWELLP